MESRVWAIGDIHGCLKALTTLVDRTGIHPQDTIVTLGDYVDRGPDSRGVIEWLMNQEKSGRLVPLLGNHEIMMMRSRKDPIAHKAWLASYVGGDMTLKSYGTDYKPATLPQIPEEHWDFLEHDLKPWHESKNLIFVHAGIDPNLDLTEQPEGPLYWSIFGPQKLHRSGKPIICGHTEQKRGEPTMLHHGVCIDTGPFRPSGWLTCLNVATGEYSQANQKGEFRTGELPLPPSSLAQPQFQ